MGAGMNLFRKLPLIPHITKEVEPCSSFAPKTHIFICFQQDRACSSSKLFVINADSLSPCLPDDQPSDAHMANAATYAFTRQLTVAPSLRCRSETPKVKLLIPGHIPGSFCEFRFLCLTRSAVGEGLYGPPVPGPTTGAPPEPTREHHKGTPLRINVIAWGGSHG